MSAVFYISSAVALMASAMVITRLHAVHAALYLVVSLLAVAMVFFSLGAPFIGALEIIIYAGAIMVLILFVIMLLNLGRAGIKQEKQWLGPRIWLGPTVLVTVLLAELGVVLTQQASRATGLENVGVKQVALGLFGHYLIGVELASMLLMAGLVGAYHLGVRKSHQNKTPCIQEYATHESCGKPEQPIRVSHKEPRQDG